jgi:hypothetical protein
VPVSASQISVPDLAAETGSMTGWWVPSLSPTTSTIQSDQTPDFQADPKQALSVGIFAGIFLFFRSPVRLAVSQADFSLPSLHLHCQSKPDDSDGHSDAADRLNDVEATLARFKLSTNPADR